MDKQLKLTEVVPQVKNVMSKEEFLQMGRGICEGEMPMESINYLRCKLVRDEEKAYIAKKITSPDDVGAMSKNMLGLEDKDTEEVWVLHLSTRNIVTAMQMVSRGSLSETIAHPREVFKAALLNNSCAIVLLHNHPSGDSNPSGNDKKTTERLVEAGKLMGIRVLDHVIVGKGNIFSFKENALL